MTRLLLSLSLVVMLTPTAVAQDVTGEPETAAPADATAPTAPAEAAAPIATTETAQTAQIGVSEEAAPAPPGRTGPRVGRMPSVFGYTGLFHLYTADSTPPGTFTVGLFGEFFSGTDVVRSGDETTRFTGRFGLSYTPHPNVEVFGSFEALGNTSNFSDPQLIQSQGDLRLGVKGFGTVLEGLSAGGSLTGLFPTGSNDVGFDFSSTSVDFRGFVGYDLDSTRGLPLLFHLNLAYYYDNSARLFDFELQRVERFAHQVSEFDELELGLGVEVPLDYVTPFLEWRLGIPLGAGDEQDCATNRIPCPSDAGLASFPHVLTLGAKVAPLPNLALNLGLDVSLASAEATGLPGDAPYNVLFGVAYLIDPTPDVATDAVLGPTGWILGEVVDGQTGQPIPGALVSYPGMAFTPQSTAAETGRFRSYEFAPATEIAVEITHPRYQGRSFTRVILEGEDAVRIRLDARQDLAMLTGRVLDRAGTPLPASLYISGPESLQVEADPLTSEFEQELTVGRYIVTVVAADHLSDRRSLELAPGPTALEVVLEPRPPEQVAVLRGDRIELEGARVAFIDHGIELEMASETTLNQVAELLGQYPDLNLRVMAHSDDAGDVETTQQQAARVVEYLVDVGIDAGRLTAEGAGGERPRYPNITDRNRERNWRVEFLFR